MIVYMPTSWPASCSGVLRAFGGELQSHQITVQTELIDDNRIGDQVKDDLLQLNAIAKNRRRI